VAGAEEELFSNSGYRLESGHRQYDVSADGECFLFVTTGDAQVEEGPPELIVVENFFEEVKRLVPN
jgi:hypothetical protein